MGEGHTEPENSLKGDKYFVSMNLDANPTRPKFETALNSQYLNWTQIEKSAF